MIIDEDSFPNLPDSWISLSVENVCDNLSVQSKIQTKNYKLDGKLPVVDQGAALIGGYTDNEENAVTDKLPVVVFGDHTRAIKFVDFKFAAGADGIKVLAPNELMIPRLFYRFLQAVRLPDKGYARHYQHLRSSQIAVPPLNEQKRIADKLDELLKRVDACRERLDNVPIILKRFRQAVLAAATSGSLTEDWRERVVGANELWNNLSLVNVCQKGRVVTYGVIKLGKEVAGGTPCLRTSNVKWLSINTDGMKYIDPVLSQEYSRTILRGDEVLVNVRGTLGGVAVVSSDMAGWNVSREVAVVPINSSIIHPKYLAFWIGSDSSQRWLFGVQRGVAYTGINLEDLRTLPVSLPSIDEQHEIVRRVDKLFAFADRLEARYTTARKQVDKLTPSILAKAFRGELVEQDPNDEPASVLLERIKAERAGQIATKQTRGRKQAVVG